MHETTVDTLYKRLIGWSHAIIGITALFLIIGGCSSKAHQQAVASYNTMYLQQMAIMQAKMDSQAQNPRRVEMEFTPDGRLTKLIVPLEEKPMQMPKYNPPQDRSAEIWGRLGVAAVKTAGTVVGIGMISNAVVDLAEAAGGNTTNNATYNGNFSGSFNEAGRDVVAPSMTAGGDISESPFSYEHNEEWVNYDNSFNNSDNRDYDNSGPITENDNDNRQRNYEPVTEPVPEPSIE